MNEVIDVAKFAKMGTDTSTENQNRPCPPIRCAIYARALRWRSHNEEPAESQIETCLGAAREHGLLVASGHIFRDDRDSHITFSERQSLKDLLDAARSENRPFDVVLIDNNIRFSRKSHEILSVYSALSKAGVKVRVVRPQHSEVSPAATRERLNNHSESSSSADSL